MEALKRNQIMDEPTIINFKYIWFMVSNLTFLSNKKLQINFVIALGIISIPILTSPDIEQGFAIFKIAPFQRNFLSFKLLALFFLFSYYFLIPKFYVTKRWFILSFITISSYLVIIKLPEYLISDFIPNNINIPHNRDRGHFHKNYFLRFFLSKESHILQFFGVFILSLFLRVNEHLTRVKEEKLLTEIAYLRAQINPHFLFNTLNSLYALVLTKSDEAPGAILKLSNLVRYVVSESNKTYVTLEKEIDHIKNFIDLQKLRLTEKTKVTTTYKGNFNKQKITSLLLISLVENAFKYGVDVDNNSEIILDITINDNVLSLSIMNTIVLNKKQISTKKGMKNTKEQLNIFYPNKHSLEVEKNNRYYKVNLEIQLQ